MPRAAPKFHLPKSKCERIVLPKRAFDKTFGFRYVKQGSTIAMIGCPKGKAKTQAKGCKTTRAGKRICGRKVVCKVGTKAHALITPAKKGKRCPTGSKRVGVLRPMTLRQARELVRSMATVRGRGVTRGTF